MDTCMFSDAVAVIGLRPLGLAVLRNGCERSFDKLRMAV